MRRLFEEMFVNRPELVGEQAWNITSHATELGWLLENWTEMQLDETNKNPLIYGQKNIARTAKSLDIDAAEVEKWMTQDYHAYRQHILEIQYFIPDHSAFLANYFAGVFGLSMDPAPNVVFQNLRPGQMTPWHLDCKKSLQFGVSDELEHRIKRFAIFLVDQVPGQTWQINNDYLTWKKGDVLIWEQAHAPHCTANMSYKDRPTIVVTGLEI